MSYYIIIRGPAGVGKTTVAKKLAEKINGEYISFDEILDQNKLHESDGEGISKQSFLKANNLVMEKVKDKIIQGTPVIFDGCFYHKEQLEDLITNLDYKYFVFDLKATLEECIERDKSRKSIGVDSIKAVFKMVSRFDFGTAIETNGKTADEVINKIFTEINEE